MEINIMENSKIGGEISSPQKDHSGITSPDVTIDPELWGQLQPAMYSQIHGIACAATYFLFVNLSNTFWCISIRQLDLHSFAKNY